jgi:HlyD family secretion protein
LAKAQIALESSKLQLEKTKQGPKPAQIESAKASLASAQAAYQVALTKYGLTDAQIAVARAQLDKAAATIQRAQAAYEWEKNNWLNKDPTLSSQKKALDDAQDAYNTILISYNQQLANINDTGIKSAASQVAQAQSSLDKLLNTPTPEDIAQAEAAVKQSEASLKQAQAALAKASIVAPFDGTVGDVYAQIGQWATANTQAISVVDLSRLDLTITLSEVDVSKIQEGQQVEIMLDAEPGAKLDGLVTQIDLIGTTTQGVVNYASVVSINNPTDALRPGMNASASIILQHREDVLLVPNRAVRTSGRTRTATVVYQGQLIDVPVTLGLSGDSQSEVASGLQEGDLVLVNQTTTTARGVPGVPGAGAVFMMR